MFPVSMARCNPKGGHMSAILQINRDFPFQIALSFDDAAMEVLDWLEDCPFEWDMFVDLPENTVRYCFRSMADASAFKQRFKQMTDKPNLKQSPMSA
jgi:hypothetical protein